MSTPHAPASLPVAANLRAWLHQPVRARPSGCSHQVPRSRGQIPHQPRTRSAAPSAACRSPRSVLCVSSRERPALTQGHWSFCQQQPGSTAALPAAPVNRLQQHRGHSALQRQPRPRNASRLPGRGPGASSPSQRGGALVNVADPRWPPVASAAAPKARAVRPPSSSTRSPRAPSSGPTPESATPS